MKAQDLVIRERKPRQSTVIVFFAQAAFSSALLIDNDCPGGRGRMSRDGNEVADDQRRSNCEETAWLGGTILDRHSTRNDIVSTLHEFYMANTSNSYVQQPPRYAHCQYPNEGKPACLASV